LHLHSPDLSFNEIGLDHYIAKGAINKKTGDTFVTNHPQKKTWSIQEIVSKSLFQLPLSVSYPNFIASSYCSYRLNNWDNVICSSGKAS
jgi:hypothetical protein